MPSVLTLILQIAIVLVACRVVGYVFRRLRQPQVVGEMAAGILLGPSVFGAISPGLFARVFPPASLPQLNTLSQLGLILFMFLVGLELDQRLLRGRGKAAFVTSWASIAIPFGLGALLALWLYPRMSGPPIPRAGFVLFMGAAMSVTAFPVLARILAERNLTRTHLGALTLACAAVNDVTAWCILAAVVLFVRSSAAAHALWVTVGGSLAFILVMVYGARYAVRPIRAYHKRCGRVTQGLLASVLLFALAAAFVTEWLGIHALFGAFLAGAVLPKDESFAHEIMLKLEDFTVVFLLPLFFAFTGLRTHMDFLGDPELWLYTGLIILVAVTGKWGGSTIAARLSGLSWREANALGVLMNTRGLMELVILNVGYDIGAIGQKLFAMMVLMALTTTVMTTPILQLIYPPAASGRQKKGTDRGPS